MRCSGGTKSGLAVGETVLFFNRELAVEFEYRCKQAGQLASKMRFLATPWVGVLESGAWLRRAQQANACAARLADKVRGIPGVRVMFPPQTNSVFLALPEPVAAALRDRGWRFYAFIGAGGCRFMCSWDTTDADIDALAADLRAAAGA